MSRSFLAMVKSGHERPPVVFALLMAVTFLTIFLIVNFPANAQEPQAVQHVVVTLKKSVTLPMPRPFSSAVVGSPEVADALPMTDRTLYIQGKQVGTTNVSIYDAEMRLIKVVDIEVALDTTTLQSKIRASTGSSGIRVASDHGQIVLSGTASDSAAADRAYNLAKSWVPVGSVVNAMSVVSPQQVMLKVRFLEVDRNASRAIGVNWSAINGSGTRGVSTGQGGLSTASPQPCTAPSTIGSGAPPCQPVGGGIFSTAGTLVGTNPGAPFGVVLAEIVNKGVQINSLITALETKGLLQRLAEPNLVALSGDTASFQAGGSIPVPTISSTTNGSVTPSITYEPYGVILQFRPTVLNNGLINLAINPTVSELDYTNAVTISGTTVPAFTTRTATTTVALRDGQSFAIAGLLQADNNRDVSQIPWLGSVPVLGTLFKSSAYQKNQTDLVIIVTPSLAQPAAPGARLATPFDNTVPSNDVDFFLFGQLEERKKYTDYVTTGGDVQGPYGYMLGVMQGPDASSLKK
jgi:pilus assembly protein CpaC